ncbi:MAG: YjbH domain-containing protein [Ignavibacteriales bacterium]|nr:YjbH domain-containing protein [Ignavibacteriales bacterium]
MLKANSYKLLFSLFLLPFSFFHGQTLEGSTGLFFIPTAEMQQDKQITVGASFIDKSLLSFSDYKKDAITPFFSFNFLPYIEISGKITRMINPDIGTQGIGDRTISLRIRLNNEAGYLPAVLVGLHDLEGVYGGPKAVRNNALYIVVSKHVMINSLSNFLAGFHLGFGSDRIRAQHHNFVGLFGGINFMLYRTFEIMGEYDGAHTNGGIRVKLFNHISLLGGLLRLKHFSGGMSFNFIL